MGRGRTGYIVRASAPLLLRNTTLAAAVGAAALLGPQACAQVLGADFDDAKRLPECVPRTWVSKPTVADSESSNEIVVAITKLDLGEEAGANGERRSLAYGFDLDKSCSGDFAAHPCLPPAWTDGSPIDGPGGVDNAVGQMLSLVSSMNAGTISSESATGNIASGREPPLAILRIRDYNVLPDDPQVTVDLYMAAAPGQLDPPAPAPDLRNPQQAWPILLESVSGANPELVGAETTGDSVYRDTTAYVNKWGLFAKFENVSIASLFGARTYAPRLYFEGHLTRGLSRWDIKNGTMAGIVDADDLLAAIPKLGKGSLEASICTNTAVYSVLKPIICGTMDVQVGDFGDPAICDAMSFGIRFEAAQGRLGPMVVLPADPADCSDSTDPENDSCGIAPAD